MEDTSPRLHHVVFAVAPERQETMAKLFTELGFTFESTELTELGVRVHLDWNRGLELISPVPDSRGSVAASVNEFLASHGDGIYTVVLQLPGATAAEDVAKRYGATTRFRQHYAGDGFHLDEVDLSVLNLPLTFLSTNVP